ncbi:hypothetical protein ALP78_100991 [Pseudomonas coronafaciens pv. striafaciens]|uniref:Uncharacterized protein n=1 Tax=Pseudomonas coronafaciens pv. striafaciens TaxID=235276 RepID=A0A3M4XYL3_9PSED|nr:hypothetical protein ALP78_100991 [Pseudomonas coronafaciens pv. striafaciens]
MAMYRLALLKSPYPMAALRRKSHIVVSFYPHPESLERRTFGVGRVWPEFNKSSTTAAQPTRINGARQRFDWRRGASGVYKVS